MTEVRLLSKFGAALAVARRDLRIMFRYPTWSISLLIWPSLFPLAYIFSSKALAGPGGESLSTYARYAGTTDYVAYILTGTFMWMWMNVTLWGLGTALRNEQQRGTLETSWLTPAPKWLLLLGSAMSDLVQFCSYMIIGWFEFYFFFGLRVHGSPALLLLVVLLTIPSVYGLGMVFASAVLWVKETNLAVNVVRGIMMVFCGMTYPISVLPLWMQGVSQGIPLTHAINATRTVIAGGNWPAVASDVTFLTVSGAVLLAAGFASFALAQRVAQRQGSLSFY